MMKRISFATRENLGAAYQIHAKIESYSELVASRYQDMIALTPSRSISVGNYNLWRGFPDFLLSTVPCP